MLNDGIKLFGTSTAVNFSIESGSSLPTSGMTTGELYFKTGSAAGLYVYNGSAWAELALSTDVSSGGGATTLGDLTDVSFPYTPLATDLLSFNGQDWVNMQLDALAQELKNDSAFSGGVSTTSTPTSGQVLGWDGSEWVGVTPKNGTVTSVAISGGTTGLTTSGGPVTVAGTITLGGILSVANGGTGLSTIGSTGQVLTVVGGAAAWQALPAASSGTVSSVSIVSNAGVSGTVATSTTTPAITLTLGNITPTQIVATGSVTGTSLGTSGGTIIGGAGVDVVLQGADRGTGAGAAMTVRAGDTSSQAVGGTLTLRGGNTSGGVGGTVSITGGTGTLANAAITISGGLYQANDVGGHITYLSGFASGTAALASHIFSGHTANTTTAELVRFLPTGAVAFGGVANVGTAGQVLTSAGGGASPTWSSVAASGAGTVTSVAVSGGTTGLVTSGGPITGAGTITLSGTLAAVNGGTGLSSFAIGDIHYASSSTALSPLTIGSTGQVLTVAGGVPTWATPTAGGTGTVTSVSVATANGISGSVATSTTTPAITLTLGAITPTTVTASGAVSTTSLTSTGSLAITVPGVNTSAANEVTSYTISIKGGSNSGFSGTGSPAAGAVSIAGGDAITNSTTNGQSGGAVNITGGTGGQNGTGGNVVISAGLVPTSGSGGNIVFYTAASTSQIERFRITNTGALAFAGSANYGTANQVLTSNGNAAPTWSAVPYDIGLSYIGVATAGTVAVFVAPRAFTIPTTGHIARAGAASTSTTATLTLLKNGTSFGTVLFNASATGVFTISTATTFAVGDRLTVSLGTADTTLADVGLTLVATL